MQQLCKERLAWYDDIPEQLQKMEAWLQELLQLSKFSVAIDFVVKGQLTL